MATRKFKLVHGRHAGPGTGVNVKHYKKGDVVDSDEPLDVLFPNKFKKLPANWKKAVEEVDEELEEEDAEVDDPAPDIEVDAKAEKSLGKDVTDDFPGIADEGFIVYKGAFGRYFVAKKDAPTVALNEKGIKKTEVDGFVEENL